MMFNRVSVKKNNCFRMAIPLCICLTVFPNIVCGETKPRSRDLGIPFEGSPGPLNAITDVPGVEVGHTTLIEEKGTSKTDRGPVRTGLTAVFPLGKESYKGVAAARFVLNGAGELTGSHFVDEFGVLFGPIAITNTLSLGLVRDAVIEWYRETAPDPMLLLSRSLPMVAETWDGELNDIYGFHIKKAHVFSALDSAKGGPVAEGNVGGGTGMTAYEFKAGIGTSSRAVSTETGNFTVGVLVQANYGWRHQLIIAGVPVGKEITDMMPSEGEKTKRDGSIVVVVATDAPLLPFQLKRVAKRASMGLARNGSIANDTSGDIIIAFSTANTVSPDFSKPGIASFDFIPHEAIDPVFSATIEATEEAIINALIAAESMTGMNGMTFHAIPHDRLREVLKKYNRLSEKTKN